MLFQSIATYGIIAWGRACKNLIRYIFNLHKKMIKAILRKGTVSYKKTFLNVTGKRNCYNWLKIRVSVFETEILEVPATLKKLPIRRKEIERKAYDCIGREFFNSLPVEIGKNWGKKVFKNQISLHLLLT